MLRSSITRYLSNIAGGAALATAFAISCAGAVEPISIDNLSRLPQLRSVSLSSDGQYLVALVANNGKNSEKAALSLWDLDNPSKPPVLSVPGGNAEFIQAAALKAHKVLVVARNPYTGETFGCDGERTVGVTHTFLTKLFFTDFRMKKFKDPFNIAGLTPGMGENTRRCLEIARRGAVRSDLLTLDPENIIVAELDTRSFRVRYSKYNLRTGKTDLLFLDSSDESAGLLDPRDGGIWTKEKVDFEDGVYQFETLIRNAETGEFEVHDKLTWNSKSRYDVEVVGRDEATGKFYVITDQFRDKAAVYYYDPVKGDFDPEPLFAHPQYVATGVVLGKTKSDFNKLLGFRYLGAAPEIYWIDDEFRSIDAALKNLFPNTHISIVDYAMDKSRILFTVSGSDSPPKYYILQNKSKLILIGESAAWIDADRMSKSELVYYAARDGLKIPAFLTPPTGWKTGDQPGPAVVLPHGGPWARDFEDWDETGWVQYFASRGYAILQPQFRGSTGWGRNLWLAGDAEWGQKMQDDNDDGARWMISQKIAEPGKIVIFGYSYGGFAAFAASVRDASPYRCAIAGAGISDLGKLGRSWSDNRLQRFFQGRTVRGFDPIENTDKIHMPILIFHGDRDVRVPTFHSKNFFNQVKGRVPADYVVIEDMPHSLPWTPTQKKKVLEAIDGFLKTDCAF